LFRHSWITVKFLLTIVAVIVLLLHMPTLERVAQMTLSSDFRTLQIQLLAHAGGGLLLLLTATALSVYKPWGRIRYRTAQAV
jgi:hypothetical protein